MQHQIILLEGYYVMTIQYSINFSKQQAWHWLATSQGLAVWFPELSIEGEGNSAKLVFQMEDFREEMAILEYIEEQLIRYEWDQAVVAFELSGSDKEPVVTFTERIPADYHNDYGDATSELAGWSIHNERLAAWMKGEKPPTIKDIHPLWEARIKQICQQLHESEIEE